MINIYTDGACSGNPGPGGWAIVKESTKTKLSCVYSGAKDRTTNNEMELTAVLEALQFAGRAISVNKALLDESWNIYTDSAYVFNCFDQKWYEYWIAHNWTTKSKTKVKNQELWEQVIKLYQFLQNRIKLTIHKVEGHSNNRYNNLADQYAVAARKGTIHNGSTI